MAHIRSLVRTTLRRLGFGVWKINSSETLNFENLLYVLLRAHQTISLLHIGAHDGKSFSDPLYHFVIQNADRISGVYVEPVKSTYDKLVNNLGEFSQLKLLNIAVHPTLRSVDIHQMEGLHGDRAKQASGLSSANLTRLQRDTFNLRPTFISKTTVPAISIEECLSHLPVEAQNNPLVMCVDTEGMDFEIVKSVIEGPRRPFIIRFEHNLCDVDSSSTPDEYQNLLAHLNSVGYQVFTEHNDATAIHIQMLGLTTKPYD